MFIETVFGWLKFRMCLWCLTGASPVDSVFKTIPWIHPLTCITAVPLFPTLNRANSVTTSAAYNSVLMSLCFRSCTPSSPFSLLQEKWLPNWKSDQITYLFKTTLHKLSTRTLTSFFPTIHATLSFLSIGSWPHYYFPFFQQSKVFPFLLCTLFPVPEGNDYISWPFMQDESFTNNTYNGCAFFSILYCFIFSKNSG